MSASRSALLVILAVVIASFAAHAQDSANTHRATAVQPPEPRPQETFAPYWTSEPGWETELQLKNNLASGSLTVMPVLRLADGTEFPLEPVTIASNAAVSVPVNQVLLKKFPSLLNRPGAFGSVAFRFASFSAENLHALVSVQKQSGLIGFHFDAYAPSARQRPGSREGIWWLPRRGTKDVLIIANSAAKTVPGTLWLSDALGKRWSSALTLIPYQTQRLSVGALVRKAGLSGSYGGIAVDLPASAQAVDSAHVLYDERSGFSSLMKMVDLNPAQTLRERTGSDDRPWTLWAPMLALSAPDPATGFPAGTALQPTILVRNVTDKKQSASITLSWRGDSGKGRAKLPGLILAPFETRQIQVSAMQKQLGIPNDAHWALVTLTTSAKPDELIAEASSYDAATRYGMQSPIYSGVGDHFVGGEWRVDTNHNTLMAITNGGTRTTDALLTLYYENGRKKYEMRRTIQPGEQVWLNFADLIHHRIPDRKGRMLPADLASGTHDLRDLNPGKGGQLIGSEFALDTTLGEQAQPNILRCCGVEYPALDPDLDEILFDQYGNLDVQALDCNGDEVDISYDFSTWWSSDNSIAQVTYKQAYGVSPGYVSDYASGEVPIGNGGYCTVEPVQVGGGVWVAQKCGDKRDQIIQEYVTYDVPFLPLCSYFTQTAHSYYFTFSELNTGDYPWALVRQPLTIAQSSGYGLDLWRADYGSSRIVSSAYRNPARNYSVGGASNSRHMYGDAVDLKNQSGTQAEWNAMVAAATSANADYIEPQNGPCGLACTHADWRSHAGGYSQ